MIKKTLTTVALGLLLSGCASSTNPTPQNSGFLDDYSTLKKSPHDPATLLYIASDVDFSTYDHVMVEPVKIMANNEQIKANSGLLKEMSEYMTQKVRTKIRQNPNYTLVTKPQANTLKVEYALTAATVAHTDREVYEYIPVALVITEASRASGMSKKDARVLVELRVSDANTGKIVSRAISSQKGEKVTLKEEELTLKVLKPALDRYAQRINERLDQVKKSIRK